jgi:farnesol dehydrogenase
VLVNELTVLGPTRGSEARDETSIAGTTPLETLVREYAEKGVGVKAVYSGMGYGFVRAPGHGGLARHTLLRLAAGKSLAVPGNGRNPLALGYFKDTVQGILLAHSQGRSGHSYILAGEPVTWPELLEIAAGIVGQAPPRRCLPLWWMRLTAALPAEVLTWAGREWRYRSDKARLELGWRPVSIQDGLAETWDDYQALGWGARAGSPLRVMRRA